MCIYYLTNIVVMLITIIMIIVITLLYGYHHQCMYVYIYIYIYRYIDIHVYITCCNRLKGAPAPRGRRPGRREELGNGQMAPIT